MAEKEIRSINGMPLKDAKARTSLDTFKKEISSQIKEISNKSISIRKFGDYGNWQDSTKAFTDAINYINENNVELIIPAGVYVITSDLPKIKMGSVITGMTNATGSNQKAKIIDRRRTGGYLFDFSIDGVIGGSVSNLVIINEGESSNKCINLKSKGWMGSLNNLYIYNFSNAITSTADDYAFNNVQVIRCGNTSDSYAIELIGNCNHHTFNTCHIEQCFNMVRFLDGAFNNSFVNCHIEMNADNITDLYSPIYSNSSHVSYLYENVFDNCKFTFLDSLHYVEGGYNLNQTPYMISNEGNIRLSIRNSTIVSGNLSNQFGLHTSSLKLAQGEYISITGNSICGLSHITPCVYEVQEFKNNYCIIKDSEDLSSYTKVPCVKSEHVKNNEFYYRSNCAEFYPPTFNNKSDNLIRGKYKYPSEYRQGTGYNTIVIQPCSDSYSLNGVAKLKFLNNQLYGECIISFNSSSINIISSQGNYKDFGTAYFKNGKIYIQKQLYSSLSKLSIEIEEGHFNTCYYDMSDMVIENADSSINLKVV